MSVKLSNQAKRGFSLIEVCLAVLVIGLGLLPIFGLFPSGLRSMEESTSDTRCALFTETIMNGMRANAALISDWSVWTAGSFSNDVVAGVLPDVPVASGTAGINKIQFPAGGDWLRYRLSVSTNNHSALVEVCDGEYGPFNPPHSSSYTEFYFQGM